MNNISKKDSLDAELMGANEGRIMLTGNSTSTYVKLDRRLMRKVSRSYARFADSESKEREPDHLFLNLENIRSKQDGHVIDIYINLPGNADPKEHEELHAGTIGLFGVRKASLPDESHGGMGATEILNVTRVMDELYLAGGLDLSDLEVNFRPGSALKEEDQVTIERVSLYRHGQ